MSAQNLAGKKIVITAGTPHEDIDGVRHYANHARLESHGFALAAKLAALGADVTVVSPKNALVPPPGCTLVQTIGGRDIVSGRDVMDAAKALTAQGGFDGALCLSSISSIRPAEVSANKLKVKKEAGAAVEMSVVGNVDVGDAARTWDLPVRGFDNQQISFASSGTPAWLASIDIEDQGRADYPVTVGAAKTQIPESNELAGKTIVMTSGPTEEQVTATNDVITNFSSGQQGYELARRLAAAGAHVVYVVGRTSYPPPAHGNIEIVNVTSAKSMLAAAMNGLPKPGEPPAAAFIGVAAVADFGCPAPLPVRLAENEPAVLTLSQNPDILYTMGHLEDGRPLLVIGFAAETDPANIMAYAQGKLEKKRADLICANLVGRNTGHAGTENQIVFVSPGAKAGEPPVADRLPVMAKSDAAAAIVAKIASLLKKVVPGAATRTDPRRATERGGPAHS
ncbi:MAG: phosphopantothenoylcysteine decarboxylase [Alphaproteobacteria bacterium]|nr:phosphopantothenoylcysteine decarboxylase [Alphaproteobacteria bacterium]